MVSGSVYLLFLKIVFLLTYSHDNIDRCYTGSNADYPMDMHHKEQLHENSILMMQSQQLSVSFSLSKNVIGLNFLPLKVIKTFTLSSSAATCRWEGLVGLT